MSDEVEFLSDLLSRPWSPDGKSGLKPVGLFIGQGTNALEVAVAQASQAPARSVLVEIWKARKGRRVAPLLLVVLQADSASITGATGEVPPVYTDMDIGQVERLCREALAQPDRHAVLRLLSQALPSLETALPGLTNEGLLALHELEHGVPKRGGVYYEAGFAHGLGIEVIFTCREDALKHVHFDTRQYNHIVWETPEELRERLAKRISARIGDGPHKENSTR